MVETVWVVRHGQRRDTVDPEFHTYADRVHDPDLTELGRWQAWRCGRYFAEQGVGFDAVYASPFLRTVQTADEICRETDHEFQLEPGLGEHRNAEWFDSDPETAPHESLVDWFETLRLDHDSLVVPEFPEDHHEAETRAGEAARRLVETSEGTVLMVGHGLTVGGVVQGLVGSTEGVDAPLCGLTRLENRGDEWELDISGAVDHLE
jgi:broad specificity phosphatase PhoE